MNENGNIGDTQFIRISESYAKLLKTKLSGTKTDLTVQNITSVNTVEVLDSMNNGVRHFPSELTTNVEEICV